MGKKAYELIFDVTKRFNEERKHRSLKLFKQEDIFLVAVLERGDLTPNIDVAMYLYERYEATNEIPQWLEDWCIDVMCGKHGTACFAPVQEGGDPD